MSKINIDFNSILQPIKDAQNELTKLLSQMQEASKASQSMAAGIRSSGGSRFSSIEAAGNYVKNMRSIHGDNVIAMPGVPLSNLDPSQHASSPTTSPTNPIAQAARANVSSNLDSVSFARALNTSFDLQKSAPNRQAMINNLQKGDQVSKYFGNQMSDLGDQSSSLQKQIADLSKQALDSNGREIKANTEANNKLREAISKLNKTTDELTSLQDEANKYLKGAGGGGGGGSYDPSFRGMAGRAFNAIGGVQGLAKIGVVGGAAISAYGEYVQKDATSILSTNTNLASANQALFQQQMGAAAPMSGRDILRNYGNLMALDVVGKNSYLGIGGLGRAQTEAQRIQTQRLSGAGTSFAGGLIGSMSAGAATGLGYSAVAASLLAATGVGLPLAGAGAGLMAAGGALTAGAGYLFGNNNEYMRSKGGLPGILGTEGGRRAADLYRSERFAEEVSLSRQMQENELDSREASRRATGLDVRTAALRVQLSGTSLVGGRSMNALNAMVGTDLGNVSAGLSNRATANEAMLELVKSIPPDTTTKYVAGGNLFSPQTMAVASGAGTARLKQLDNANIQYNLENESISNQRLKYSSAAAAIARDTLMDPSEYGAAGNLLMSVGGRRSDTTAFAKMRFAGVGSTEQLASQMLGLQSSTNQPLSISEFKKTLSEGVSSGFSSAPLMQAFMGTLTQLSQNLGVTDVNTTARDLGMLSSGLSVTGTGGMRSLREASAAMGSINAYTGQSAGVVGMLKTVAGYSAGVNLQSGLGVLNTMNMSQLNETRSSLEKIASSSNPQQTLNELEKSGKISLDAARMARMNINNVGGAAGAARAMVDAAQAPIRGFINLSLGGKTTFKDIASRMGQLMLTKGGMKSEKYKTLETQLSTAIEGSGVDRNSAFIMAKESAFSSMTSEQRRSAEINMAGSGGAFAKAQRAGEKAAKSDDFLAAQKSLSARLGVEAALGIGGSASADSVAEAAKGLGMSIPELKKKIGTDSRGQVRATDLAAFMSESAGQTNTVNIGGFSTTALSQFALAIARGTRNDTRAKEIEDSAPGRN